MSRIDSAGKPVLLVDDDVQALNSTQKILQLEGYEVHTAADGHQALEKVRAHRYHVIVSDVRMPRLGGLEFLRALSLCGETAPVILMTAYGRVEDAVWAMKLGAVDFLTKPFKRQALISAVASAIRRSTNTAGSVAEQDSSGSQHSLERSLIGSSEVMCRLVETIQQVARSSATVLLSGESGTGKELVARSIHDRSPRAEHSFIALNCAAVPEQLIESELFGFEKGAFTGAGSAKAGLFEAAHGGTLLLDEIGDMPISLQAKLLRTLQEGEVRRLGATTSKKVDVRVIAATHWDLREAISEGRFRQDLLYRLEVIELRVPPLRERMEDIPDLTQHFLKTASLRHGKVVTQISTPALRLLCAHSWPGNVRELSNVIERAVVFAESNEICPEDLPPHLQSASNPVSSEPVASNPTISVRLGTPLKEVEELLIRKTLEATDGDKNMTAKLLGINSRTIYRKFKR